MKTERIGGGEVASRPPLMTSHPGDDVTVPSNISLGGGGGEMGGIETQHRQKAKGSQIY